MYNIDKLISESKNKDNISNGGSVCYDFGDVVLVKYSIPIKYIRNNERARYNEEEVMEGINKKANDGVNTPRHLQMKRVIEGENDVCYVLEEKAKGINCAEMSKQNVSFDELKSSLEYINNIPFEHYKKLVSDTCNLYEMGFEAKNKNLFYDEETGFWFIDFLENYKNDKFDSNNIVKVFNLINYILPKPIQLASSMKYGSKLTNEQQEEINNLTYSINSKLLLAIREVIPNFKKYEKFYLINKDKKYKKYLMDNKIVDYDLFSFEEKDYEIYNELYDLVVFNLIESIVNYGNSYSNIKVNDIRNDSLLFNLVNFWMMHKDNVIKKEDYFDDYKYEYDVKEDFINRMLTLIYSRLLFIKSNSSVEEFLLDYKSNMKSR